jgi:hypothetical protein
VVAYDYNNALYKAGAEIAVTENITVKQVSLDLAMIKGASVRKAYNENGYGGLRFHVTANADTLSAYGESITLKGAVLPTDMIVDTFDANEAGAQQVNLTEYTTKQGVNEYYITLTNIYYSNYSRNFSARAFATVTYADKTSEVFATEYDETYARSIYNVACEALEKGESDNAGVLAQYVNYTVNLEKNGDTYTVMNTGAKYAVEGKVLTISEIPANIASQVEEGKLWISVTVWEGETATRTVVQATYADGVATCTLS